MKSIKARRLESGWERHKNRDYTSSVAVNSQNKPVDA